MNSVTELKNAKQRHFLCRQELLIRSTDGCNLSHTQPSQKSPKRSLPSSHASTYAAISKHAGINKYTRSKMKNTKVVQSCQIFFLGGGGHSPVFPRLSCYSFQGGEESLGGISWFKQPNGSCSTMRVSCRSPNGARNRQQCTKTRDRAHPVLADMLQVRGSEERRVYLVHNFAERFL